MLLTLIVCAVLGYVALMLPVAVVIGRALREPLDPYAAAPAAAYPAASVPVLAS